MAKKINTEWRNRIVSSGTMPAIQFVANPSNWRIHPKAQREALSGVLNEVGWVQNVIVNKTTGNVVDGHARIEEALKRGDDTPVPYVEVELTEDEEQKILLTLDPISAMAAADKANLDALLKSVETQDAAVMAMIAELANKNGLGDGNDIDELWQGMPEFIQDDVSALKTILVHFGNEGAIGKFSALVDQQITNKTKSIWYPKRDRPPAKELAFNEK